ncbi:alpha/beta hydrolase [Kribbella sp. ALI-6-A]|uniref:alpha/beta hydrolase n=1 Tax=Kribbella sp. ALI-6-A TaxID=1933817 RepID=UPI00097BDE82|nr:alpha/beta hydrolase [Kribbella sp. ALI-6-A]ONI78170.1 alpha/beta hydrolase [Kribbella sp. ALI-6-A]
MTSRHAVIVPGGEYGPQAPLLMFAGQAAERRGAAVRPVDWQRREDAVALSEAELEAWVIGQVSPHLPVGVAGSGLLFVGKSLGTHAAALAAERGHPAVWLTPLLQYRQVVEALERSRAPFLLVGGTEDRLWDGDVARRLTPHVLEVEGADHGMFVPGRLAASAAVLGQVATAVENFLDEVVWV